MTKWVFCRMHYVDDYRQVSKNKLTGPIPKQISALTTLALLCAPKKLALQLLNTPFQAAAYFWYFQWLFY